MLYSRYNRNIIIIVYYDINKKIAATIEARMTSSRLPGKVLLPLAGKPVLERMIGRLRRSRYLDEIVIATTENIADNSIVALAERLGVKYFRGSELDVLGRVLGAARSARADIIVELTGDCPLVDWRIVDRGVEEFFRHNVDYAANNVAPPLTFPNGFDVQVFPASVLAEIDKLTQDPIDRVQVSYYIYRTPGKYRVRMWQATPEYYGPDLRLTLDEPADYELINTIFELLLPADDDFSGADVVNLLRKRPDLAAINKHVRQKDVTEG